MAASVVAGSLEMDGIRAMMQGLTPAAGTPAHAFSRGTWAVFVPGNQAAEARALLRGRGDNGVVEGAGDLSGSQLATLKFAVFGVLAVAAWGLVMVLLND